MGRERRTLAHSTYMQVGEHGAHLQSDTRHGPHLSFQLVTPARGTVPSPSVIISVRCRVRDRFFSGPTLTGSGWGHSWNHGDWRTGMVWVIAFAVTVIRIPFVRFIVRTGFFLDCVCERQSARARE